MTLRYALDTITVSAPFWREPPPALIRGLEANAHWCAIPMPVGHELRCGVARLPASRRRASLERYLQEVVLINYPLLPYDRAAAEWHASERARLERSGQVPALIDGMIAAVARVNGLILVTDNTFDFRPFRDLTLENWLRSARSP